MLTKLEGVFVAQCNGCGAVLDTGQDTYNLAKEFMRAVGWTSYKTDPDEEWNHECSKCHDIRAKKEQNVA